MISKGAAGKGSVIVKENVNPLYQSIAPPMVYTIEIEKTDASKRCKLAKKKKYQLHIRETHLRLMTSETTLYIWPYKYIRRYMMTSSMFIIEVGRRCDSGEGFFNFKSPKASDIYSTVQNERLKDNMPYTKSSDIHRSTSCPDTSTTQIQDQVLPRSISMKPPSPHCAEPKCTYAVLCHRFLQTLNIKDAYMNKDFNICYCAKCHSSRNDTDYYERGRPAKKYGVPVGWYRAGLKTPPQAAGHKAFETWHRAYHGTKDNFVVPILEVGGLLVPGDVAMDGKRIHERPNHFSDDWKPEGFDTKKVFLSPSILYAGNNVYATPNSYVDKETKKVYHSRVAFQVLIKPNKYNVDAETTEAAVRIDPEFSNDELEWSTDVRGSIIIYGLLIRMETSRA